jgi:hypothetical protein
MVHAIKRASLPKHVRGDYNQQRPSCWYAPARRLFSGRRGSIRAFRVHLDQATSMYQLSRAPRTFFGLDQTADDLLCAWNARRSDQKKVRTAGGKRPVTTSTDHLTSTNQTTHLPQERLVSPGAAGQDGSDLETGPLSRPGRRHFCGFHRELFRLFWMRKSQAHASKPKLSSETIDLIKEMAANYRLWGAERIRGELLKLDIRGSQTDHPVLEFPDLYVFW